MTYTPFKGVQVPGPERDFVGYGRRIPKVTWPNNARVAVSLVVNYEEGSEYSHPNGDGRNDGLVEMTYAMDPKYRDLCAESVFEYGSRAGIWRLERLLSEYKLPATIYACAVALERNREVGDWIREAGHEPCSHGWRWEESWRLTTRRGSRAYPHGGRVDPRDDGGTPARLVLPLWAFGQHARARRRGRRLRLRIRRVQRRSALLRGRRREKAAHRSLFDDLQRREIQPAAERRFCRPTSSTISNAASIRCGRRARPIPR